MDTTSTTIQYDDFAKLDLRVATVLECKPHPNADKLLVLQIDLGTEKRQICAGLRLHYPDPQELVGKRSEEHTSELQSRRDLVCRLLLEKKKKRDRLGPGSTCPPGTPPSILEPAGRRIRNADIVPQRS